MKNAKEAVESNTASFILVNGRFLNSSPGILAFVTTAVIAAIIEQAQENKDEE